MIPYPPTSSTNEWISLKNKKGIVVNSSTITYEQYLKHGLHWSGKIIPQGVLCLRLLGLVTYDLVRGQNQNKF